MEWFTEAEAADYLKVPEKTLRWQRYKKKIRACKIGSIVQYRKEDLDKLRNAPWEENQKASNSKNTNGRPTGTLPIPLTGEALDTARIRKAMKKLNFTKQGSSLSSGRNSKQKPSLRLVTA